MSAICNVGSLVLGLIAWGIPIAVICSKKKKRKSSAPLISSFAACAGAVLLQLLEIEHRIFVEDWSALMDTIHAIVWATVIVWIVTIGLNSIVYLVQKEETSGTFQ